MITIDISKMHVGEAIHLKDVVPPEGVEFTSNLEDILVTCNEIVVEEEPAPEAPAEGDAAAAPAPAAGAAPAAAPAADAKKAK